MDDNGFLDKNEISAVLKELGMESSKETVDQLLKMYDVDGTGTVEEEEFASFLSSVNEAATMAERGMNWTKYMVQAHVYQSVPSNIQEAKCKTYPEPWLPPDSGFVQCTIELKRNHTGFLAVTADNMQTLINATKAVADAGSMLEYALSSMRLKYDEAFTLYRVMLKESGDKMKVLLKILPRIITSEDTHRLITTTMVDMKEKLRLRSFLGNQYFQVLIGLPNGYYRLSLAEETDRLCMEALNDHANAHSAIRKEADLGDTSQYGDWCGFRNVFLDGKPFTLTKEWLENMPEAGVIEFDYASIESVGPAGTQVTLSDNRVIKMLVSMGCASTFEEEELMKRLQKMQKKSREAARGHGSRMTHEEMNEKFSGEVAKHMLKLYDPSTSKKRSKKEEELMKEIAKEENLLNSTGEGSRSATPATVATTSKKGKGKFKKASMKGTSKTINAAIASATAAVNAVTVDSSGNIDKSMIPSNGGNDNDNKGKDTDKDKDKDEVDGVDGRLERGVSFIAADPNNSGSSLVSTSKSSEMTPFELYSAYMSRLRRCNVNDSLLTLRLLQSFEDLLADKYMTCSQLSTIVKCFPCNEQISLTYSTFRVEFIIKFHPRLTDPVNFDLLLLMSGLTPKEVAMLQYRLGILNIWTPLKPEGFIHLDLSRREERQILRMLLVLSLSEGSPAASIYPGSEKFWTKPEEKDSIVPDFKIPATWYKESDLPTQGMVSFRYVSGTESFTDSLECKPNIITRFALTCVTLAQPYAKDCKGHYRPTILRAEVKSEELGMQLAFSTEQQSVLLEKKKWIRKNDGNERPQTPPPSDPISPRTVDVDDPSNENDNSTVNSELIDNIPTGEEETSGEALTGESLAPLVETE